ncbi:hypothetical protein A2U01_0118580, partial [Trifolium medium]|nr:hypothetical protein [Trifolium medium]
EESSGTEISTISLLESPTVMIPPLLPRIEAFTMNPSFPPLLSHELYLSLALAQVLPFSWFWKL